jgi:uncharacterized membrane protein
MLARFPDIPLQPKIFRSAARRNEISIEPHFNARSSTPGHSGARTATQREAMLEYSKTWIEYLAIAVEVAAALVIGIAAVEALWKALPLFLRSEAAQQAKVEVRLGLGRWLALGLEFALAADILRTAIAPTWREIGQLAAIATLRTALNFFLEREIDREDRRVADGQRRLSAEAAARRRLDPSDPPYTRAGTTKGAL